MLSRDIEAASSKERQVPLVDMNRIRFWPDSFDDNSATGLWLGLERGMEAQDGSNPTVY